MRLEILPKALAICRLAAADAVPPWANGPFLSITRTESELSIVCDFTAVPQDVKSVAAWRALRVEGPLDFSLTGILASLAQPLAEAAISIFAISTYDTDYVLVREGDLAKAIEILSLAGHSISGPSGAVR